MPKEGGRLRTSAASFELRRRRGLTLLSVCTEYLVGRIIFWRKLGCVPSKEVPAIPDGNQTGKVPSRNDLRAYQEVLRTAQGDAWGLSASVAPAVGLPCPVERISKRYPLLIKPPGRTIGSEEFVGVF
jgi:hypothetical protein